MQRNEMYFERQSWPELERLLESERTLVLLFPVGATEPHGPHAPLSTDMIISAGICERVARKLEDDGELKALILPPFSFGVTRYAGSFPGVIHISEEALHSTIVEACTSLIDQGFRYIALVNNHFEPEHVQTLHRSLDTIEEMKGTRVGFMDLTREERALALTEEFQKAECHAGRYETSLVLADHPDLVDREIMAGLPYVPVNLAKVMSEGIKDFKEMGLLQAYNGSPAEATEQEGEEVYAILTDMLVDILRALVRGTGGRDGPGLYTRI